MNTDQSKSRLWIGDWRVQPALSEIHKDDKVIQLEPKVMDLLVELASRPGEVFSRQELETTIWQGTIVGYDALSKVITKLRDALGDDKKNPQYIQTISKKGYRLIATVKRETAPPSPSTTPFATDSTEPQTRPLNRKARALGWFAIIFVVVVLAYQLYAPQNILTEKEQQVANYPSQSQLDSKPVIVVLPFRNISPADNDTYLADGMTSDLITKLSRLSGLWVTAIKTTQSYKNIDISPEKAQQEFNANYLLNGDVAKVGDMIRINIHLTDIKHGNVLWADRYDRKFTDFFTVQDEVTNKITQSLEITLTKEEKQRIARRYTHNLLAYEYFLKAQYLVNARSAAENVQAREFYNKAIELDPGFARAYAGLAMSYAVGYNRQWPSDIESPLETILSLSERAIKLDKDLPESYWVAGYVHANQKNIGKAKEYLTHALVLSPNYADAYAMLASVYISIGNPEAALEHMAKANRLNPNGGHLYLIQFGRAYYFLEDYNKALHYFTLAREGNPNNIDVLLYLIATYVNLNKFDEAHWSYMEARNISPNLEIRNWIQRFAIVDNRLRLKLVNDLKNAEDYFSQNPS